MTTCRIRAIAVVILICMAPGCSNRPPMGQVKGTVTLDGRPLTKGSLTFEAPGLRPATARVENGQIVEATTYDLGDGVPVGSHKVAASATADVADAAPGANPGDAKAPKLNYMSGNSLIPTRYNDPGKSGLTAEVKKGANTLDFKLVSK